MGQGKNKNSASKLEAVRSERTRVPKKGTRQDGQDLQGKQEEFLDKIDKINGIGGRETGSLKPET